MYLLNDIDGYFPDFYSLTNAICVTTCPQSAQEQVSCLVDNVNCKSGTYTSTTITFDFDNMCLPENKDISSFFNYNAYATWSYDLQKGYLVLVGAALVSMAASLCFLIVIRCCTGVIIWIAIVTCIGGLLVIGIFFIL